MTHSVFLRFAVAGLCAFSLSAYAEQNTTRVDFELEAGLEHDSSLTVEELDRTSEESDTALLTRAKLDGQWKPSSPLTLKAGYNYYGRDFQDNDSFDMVLQQVYLDGSYDAGPLTLGASHYVADAELDGRDFLSFNLTSFYMSKLIDRHFFLRLASDVKDKSFDDKPQRNADGQTVAVDLYYFFNEAKSYLSFGLNSEREDSRSEELDYHGAGFKTKLSNKFQAFGKDSKLSLAYQYQNRDYDNVDPLIGEKREDKRQRAELAWELWFSDQLALISTLVRGNYTSNLDSADYLESQVSVALRLKL